MIGAAGSIAAVSQLPPVAPALVSVAKLSKPILAPAAAKATLPTRVEIAVSDGKIGTSVLTIVGEPSFVARTMTVGRAVFDLTDGYTMSIDEQRAEVFVANARTNESARIWGNAEIEVSGADRARFWGNTSLVLGNGATITLQTVADAAEVDVFTLDKVTVTKGALAMVITGIGDARTGDLTIEQGRQGWGIDERTKDGLTLHVDGAGGWVDESEDSVTTDTFALTAPGAIYGPGARTHSWAEVGRIVTHLYQVGQITALMALSIREQIVQEHRIDDGEAAHDHHDRRTHLRYADLIADVARDQRMRSSSRP